MNRPDVSVINLGELATLHVAALVDGANAWVASEGDYWTLEKDSGAPAGPDVVAPLGGSPSAGAANARWIRQGGGSGFVSFQQIVFRPGVPSAANAYATWPEVVIAGNLFFGPKTIYVDSTSAPPVIPAGTWNFNGPLSLVGADAFPGGAPDTLTIADAVLPQLERIRDLVTTVTNTTAPVITPPTAGYFIFLSGLSTVQCTGSQPLALQTGGGFLNFVVEGLSATVPGTSVVAKSEAGGFLQAIVDNAGFIDANTLERGAGGGLAGIIASPSAFLDPTQVGGPFPTAIWAESVFVEYSASTPGNWAGGVPPVNVEAALDRLAAACFTLGQPP